MMFQDILVSASYVEASKEFAHLYISSLGCIFWSWVMQRVVFFFLGGVCLTLFRNGKAVKYLAFGDANWVSRFQVKYLELRDANE